ncbi:hypothetical protein Sjap_003234 [Stephania japonica]|uniref:THH1/TOM1/TOM3 domain-containing protein n=1 Tax=Stephania japonica TaxID=461633 RepID=A0AAP0PV93_9MAGN
MRLLEFNVSSSMELGLGLGFLSSGWWEEINDSARWQDGIFFFLCAAYALVSSVALSAPLSLDSTNKFFFSHQRNISSGKCQFILIRRRNAMIAFTHLSCVTNGIVLSFVLSDCGQARSLPTDKLKIVYILVNIGIYLIQSSLGCRGDGGGDDHQVELAVVSARCPKWRCGQVWIDEFLLKESQLGLFARKKISIFHAEIRENKPGKIVAWVALSAFDKDAYLDVLDHPVLNLIYYLLTEILPSALVLYILRKLPPKRVSAQYHPIR